MHRFTIREYQTEMSKLMLFPFCVTGCTGTSVHSKVPLESESPRVLSVVQQTSLRTTMGRERKTFYFPISISPRAQEIVTFWAVGGGSQATHLSIEMRTFIYLGGCIATAL